MRVWCDDARLITAVENGAKRESIASISDLEVSGRSGDRRDSLGTVVSLDKLTTTERLSDDGLARG